MRLWAGACFPLASRSRGALSQLQIPAGELNPAQHRSSGVRYFAEPPFHWAQSKHTRSPPGFVTFLPARNRTASVATAAVGRPASCSCRAACSLAPSRPRPHATPATARVPVATAATAIATAGKPVSCSCRTACSLAPSRPCPHTTPATARVPVAAVATAIATVGRPTSCSCRTACSLTPRLVAAGRHGGDILPMNFQHSTKLLLGVEMDVEDAGAINLVASRFGGGVFAGWGLP